MSSIKNLIKGTGSYIIDEIPTPDSVLKSITTGTKVLRCNSSGTTAIQSKSAYGSWEFSVYKGADVNQPYFNIITDRANPSLPVYQEGYQLSLVSNESILLRQVNNTAVPVNLFQTAASYIANNTWYRLKVARLKSAGTFASIVPSMTTTYPADTFAVFIKGGSFGDDWTLVDTTGGSGTNPVTDSTYTTSNYFVADLDTGDRFANLKIYNGVKQ